MTVVIPSDTTLSVVLLSAIMLSVVPTYEEVLLFQYNKESIYKELEDLKEFWDPDTVDLMEWIQASTPATAAFTGSMQLLAGVRLSTWCQCYKTFFIRS